MKQQLHRACKRTNTKQENKSSHVTFTLTPRSIVRFSSQTMQRQSKGRFLVNNMSMFWFSMMSARGANPIFSNKKKRFDVQYTLQPHPSPSLPPITSHFCLTPIPLKVDVIMCITPIKIRECPDGLKMSKGFRKP